MSQKNINLKEDFYDFVNQEWMQKAKIPNDKPATGSFYELDKEIEELETKIFKEFLKNKEYPSDLKDFLTLYSQSLDFEARERQGYTKLISEIEKLNSYSSFDQIIREFKQYVFSGFSFPFNFFIGEDMKSSKDYVLHVSPASNFMPDKKYYFELKDNSKPLFDILKSVINDSLLEIEYKGNLNDVVKKAIQYDEMIAEFSKSSEEKADYTKSYNKYAFSDFFKNFSNDNFLVSVQGLVNGKPDFLIVTDPVFFENSQNLWNESNFESFKAWALVKLIFSFAAYSKESLRQIVGKFSLTLSGTKELKSKEKNAFLLSTSYYSQKIGVYYGKNFLGEEARENVKNMIFKMIEVYKNRLENNDWISEETKKMAVRKLKALKIRVGFPDVIPSIVEKLIPTEENFLDNVVNFSEILTKYHYSKWGKNVEEDEWEMSADTVNAYYNPSKNEIVFPAAILQKPFYDINQHPSANYGGIGAVIAHEISHAFDNNGAQFDEFGNLNSWWTQDDFSKFEELGKNMINLFDGIEFGNGKVNGKLTVSENIADAGGLICALEAAKMENEISLKEFFYNWARVWRMKASDKYTDLLLNVDVHAPCKLRANVQAKNLDDFYETFKEIDENSNMYLPLEKRVKIW